MMSHKNNHHKFSIRVFFLIYDFIIIPIGLSLFFSIGLLFNRKVRQGFLLRKQVKVPLLPDGCIWIHASSGEFEYAKPVITAIKKIQPKTTIVVSYFSPSYAPQIKKFPGVDHALPLPIESRAAVRNFIKKINPQAMLIARTDLWPQTLRELNLHEIPTLLFSCTYRDTVGVLGLFKKWFHQLIIPLISDIYLASEVDLLNLTKVYNHPKLQIKGDTRYDQVIARLKHSKITPRIFNQNLPILVAGSTWPEDERVLLPALAEMLRSSKLTLILAPHEPSNEHLNGIIENLNHLKLSHQRISQCMNWESQVLLIDQVGILAELYLEGDIGFVGGSFKDKVHSVMEPLAAGLPVLVGPHYNNNREATIFLSREVGKYGVHAVCTVSDQLQLAKAVEELLRFTGQKNDLKSSIQSMIVERTGATRHILNWLATHKLLDQQAIGSTT